MNPKSPTTPTTAGRELDEKIAVDVMKWKRMTHRERMKTTSTGRYFDDLTDYWHDSEGKEVAPIDQECDCGQSRSNWSPSTDISAAMEVVDKIDVYEIKFHRFPSWNIWRCKLMLFIDHKMVTVSAEAETRPMALCLAALKATGGRGE